MTQRRYRIDSSSDIVSLKDVADPGKFGGKAANLARLLHANLPVPQGFVVGLEAFNKNGSLKSEARQQVQTVLDTNKLYAVRSSALAEDSLGASWAGQFETFLKTPANDVPAKIEACHTSTKARARAYAEGKLGTEGFQIAVVVQEMIDPTYAGLSFTKDPSTGANQIIIEYVKGLGEPLVHGDVDPERVVWLRTSRRVKEQTEQKLPIPLRELINLSEKVETSFGGVPQDIELHFADHFFAGVFEDFFGLSGAFVVG